MGVGMVGKNQEYHPGRLFALGAIHGSSMALRALVGNLNPEARDTLVVLGDMIDCGPDSRGVLQILMDLRRQTRLIHLLGDHEELLLQVVAGQAPLEEWLARGGVATLESYGVAHPADLPAEHLDFLWDARLSYCQGDHLFAHAGYLSHWPLPYTPREILLGQSGELPDRPHYSGNRVILGHAPAPGEEPVGREALDSGYAICLQSGGSQAPWVTAIELPQSRLIQADRKGRVRHPKSFVRF